MSATIAANLGAVVSLAPLLALSFRPRVLCLDEPLSALDSETQRQMCTLLEEVSQREHVTVLHVTHNLDEARRLADCLFSLVDGKIQQVETIPEQH